MSAFLEGLKVPFRMLRRLWVRLLAVLGITLIALVRLLVVLGASLLELWEALVDYGGEQREELRGDWRMFVRTFKRGER